MSYSKPWLPSACFLFCAAQTLLAQPVYLTIPPPYGDSFTELVAVSADGTAVVGKYYDGGYRPFRWTATDGSIEIRGEQPIRGEPTCVSGGGLVVIGFGDIGGSLCGWRWTEGAGVEPLPAPRHGGLVIPHDVSADGLAVAGTLFNGQPTSFRWTQSVSYQNLPAAGANPQALAISGDGSAVLGRFESGGTRVFYWRADTGTIALPLNYPPESASELTMGLSYDGRYVVGAVDESACRYDIDTSTLTMLTWPDGSPVSGRAKAVSADGTIVVGNLHTDMGNAFIWDAEHQARELPNSTASVIGMSADGKVIAGSWWLMILEEPTPYRGRPPCQGDVDGDQRVGLSDLLFVLGEWRQPEPDVAADITGDGIVDQLDLNIVLVDFGDDCARRIQHVGR
ncbi:MAG: hypothetical protein AMXMBFR47_19460 [Planctomycetota bacterium]